jgi:hypothetical protein
MFNKNDLIIKDKWNNISFIRKDWEPFIWDIKELKCKKDNIQWYKKNWSLIITRNKFIDNNDGTYTIYPDRAWIPIYIF